MAALFFFHRFFLRPMNFIQNLSPSHRLRLGTSLVLLPVLALLIYLGGWYIFGGVLVVSLLGLYEFYSLFWNGRRRLKFSGLAFAVLLLLAAELTGFGGVLGVFIAAFWFGALYFLGQYSFGADKNGFYSAVVLTVGLLYVPMQLQFALGFTSLEIVLVLLLTIVSDTGAYYCGSLVGGRNIWPKVSPKKTWAGSFGGLVLAMAFSVGFGLCWGEKIFPQASWWVWGFLGVVLNVAAQFGDFFESALKRSLEVKDSGHFLPGHGGVLDRIDGLLLVLPAYAAFRVLYPLIITTIPLAN